jgi:hypothetical protein
MIPFSIILDGDNAWPDIRNKRMHDASIVGVAVLNEGMQSGKPSVAFRIDLKDGSVVIAQTSARLFCGAAKAIMTRYPDLFKDN